MNRQKIFAIIILLFFFFLTGSFGQSAVGSWKVINGCSGVEKSIVEIYQENGMLHGKISKVLNPAYGTHCRKCHGPKRDQPFRGLVVIENLKEKDNHWKKGNIMDPMSGKVFACSIWLNPENTDQLKVRSRHWTGLYDTQTWYRVE